MHAAAVAAVTMEVMDRAGDLEVVDLAAAAVDLAAEDLAAEAAAAAVAVEDSDLAAADSAVEDLAAGLEGVLQNVGSGEACPNFLLHSSRYCRSQADLSLFLSMNPKILVSFFLFSSSHTGGPAISGPAILLSYLLHSLKDRKSVV